MSATIGNLVVYLTANTRDLQSALSEAERSIQGFGRRMQNTGRSLTMALTVPLVGIGIAAIKAASEFEQAMIGVQETTRTTGSQLQQLEGGFRDLAKRVPVTAAEIAKVGEVAGQIGIHTQDVLSFTEAMINFSQTSDIGATEATQAFGQLIAVLGLSQDQVSRLTSSVNELHDNFNVSTQSVMDMMTAISGGGAAAGMTEWQIAALATAMSALDVNAMAMGRTMTAVAKAVWKGGDELQMVAQIAGMTASQFKQAYEQDAAGALLRFIEGLKGAVDSGQNVYAMLDALKLGGGRLLPNLLKIAEGSDLVRQALETSGQAYSANTAVAEEAARRYMSLHAQLAILWNRAKDVAITLGEALTPALLVAFDAAGPVLAVVAAIAESFTMLPMPVQMVIVGLLALAAALGPIFMVIGVLAKGVAGLAAAFYFMIPIFAALLTPMGAVAVGIVGLGLLFYTFRDDIGAALSGAWGAVKGFFIDNFPTLTAFISSTLDWISEKLNAFWSWWSDLWSNVTGLFQGGQAQGAGQGGAAQQQTKAPVYAPPPAAKAFSVDIPDESMKKRKKQMEEIRREYEKLQVDLLESQGKFYEAEVAKLDQEEKQKLELFTGNNVAIEQVQELYAAKREEIARKYGEKETEVWRDVGQGVISVLAATGQQYQADLLNIRMWLEEKKKMAEGNEAALVYYEELAQAKKEQALTDERARQEKHWTEVRRAGEEATMELARLTVDWLRLNKQEYQADLMEVNIWLAEVESRYGQHEGIMAAAEEMAGAKREEARQKERARVEEHWKEVADTTFEAAKAGVGMMAREAQLRGDTYTAEVLEAETWYADMEKQYGDNEALMTQAAMTHSAMRVKAAQDEVARRQEGYFKLGELEVEALRAKGENREADLKELDLWLQKSIQEYAQYGPGAMEQLDQTYWAKKGAIYKKDLDEWVETLQKQRKAVEDVETEIDKTRRLFGKEGVDRKLEEIRIEFEARRKSAQSMLEIQRLNSLEEMELAQAVAEEHNRIAQEAADAWSGAFHDFFVGIVAQTDDFSNLWKNLKGQLKRTLADLTLRPLTDALDSFVQTLYSIPLGMGNLGMAMAYGGLGWLAGGQLAYATGGNEMTGGIGGAMGGVFGTIVGGPMGGLLGVMAGGFLGGMFGDSSKKKKQQQEAMARAAALRAEAEASAADVLKIAHSLEKEMATIGFPLQRTAGPYGQPLFMEAFGESVQVAYDSYGKITDAGKQALEDFVNDAQQIFQKLRSTMISIIGGGLGAAFKAATVAEGVEAFAQNLKQSIYDAISEALTEGLMNTAFVKARLAPIMDLLARTFKPDAVWGPAMEGAITQMVEMTKNLATDPAILETVRALAQFQRDMGVSLGLVAAATPAKAGIAVTGYQHGGTTTEPIYGIGPSGQHYMVHAGETITPKGEGQPESRDVHVHIEGAYIGDERSMQQFAREIGKRLRVQKGALN